MGTPFQEQGLGALSTTVKGGLNNLIGSVAAGTFLRGNGVNAVMSPIQVSDVPTLNQNTTGTAAGLSVTLGFAGGGTSATTQQNALNAIAGAVTSGYVLRGNGTNVVMGAIQASDIPTLNQNTTGTAANVSGTVAIANGGTGATGGSAAFQNLNRSAALRETASGTLVIGGNYNIWTGGGALTMYLPAAASTAYGDKIYITNLELTWATNNFTIAAPASTVYINQVSGGSLVCNVNAGGFTLVCSWQDGTNAFWVVQ